MRLLHKHRDAIHELRQAAANVRAIDLMFRAQHDAGTMTDEQYRLSGEFLHIEAQRIMRELRWTH